jgi:hypothetical protein
MASSEIKAQGHGISSNEGPHDAGLCECWHNTKKSLPSRKTRFKLSFLLSPDTLQVLWGKTKVYEGGRVCISKKSECPPDGHSAFSNTYHTLQDKI